MPPAWLPPDDLEEFRACQKTYQATSFAWNDMTRGLGHQVEGPSERAQALGMNEVLSSGARTEDEGLYPIQHTYWESVIEAALDAEDADLAAGTDKNQRNEAAAAKATQEFARRKAAARAEQSGSDQAAGTGEVGANGRRRRRRRKA